jgi:DNA-binding transcriptional regulator of glucitol operon
VNAIVAVFLALGAAWALQWWLTFQQARRFQRALRDLRGAGRTAVGMARRRGRRAYVALAVDDDDVVVGALQLAGRTVFAGPRPVPALIGRTLRQLSTPDDTLPAKAAAHAASFLYRKRSRPKGGESGIVTPLSPAPSQGDENAAGS